MFATHLGCVLYSTENVEIAATDLSEVDGDIAFLGVGLNALGHAPEAPVLDICGLENVRNTMKTCSDAMTYMATD